MNKKEAVKRNLSKRNKPTERMYKHRGAPMIELLFATAAMGTTVLVTAMYGPKLPPLTGD